MSSTSSPLAQQPVNKPAQLAFTLVIGVTILALCYPLWSLFLVMQTQTYYQHSVFVLVAAFAIAAYRLYSTSIVIQGNTTKMAITWAIIGLLLTCLVFVFPSRWISCFAIIACFVAAAEFYGGKQLRHLLFPAFILLLATIPMPAGYDRMLVVNLQRLATGLSSYWLEAMGMSHFVTGVEIQTAKHAFLVKDACSGINSVFSALAVGVAYGIWINSKPIRLLLLVSYMVAWAVIANAVRIFIIVYSQDELGVDLTSGTAHQVLGIATFFAGCLLAISTDSAYRYFFPLRERVPVADDSKSAKSGATSMLPETISPKVFAAVLTGTFATMASITVTNFEFDQPIVTPLSIEEMAELTATPLDSLSENTLPGAIGKWSRAGYSATVRDSDSVFGGMVSHAWQYSDGVRQIVVSLDAPYDEWHDLAVCYRGVGWSIPATQNIKLSNGDDFFRELTMNRAPVDNAIVQFLCVDPDGSYVSPPAYFGDGMNGLVRRFGFGFQDREGFEGGVMQLQLMDQRTTEIDTDQRTENRELFKTIASHLFSSLEGED